MRGLCCRSGASKGWQVSGKQQKVSKKRHWRRTEGRRCRGQEPKRGFGEPWLVESQEPQGVARYRVITQRRLRQEDCNFKVSLSMTLSQKKKEERKEGRIDGWIEEGTINICSSFTYRPQRLL